MSAIFPASYSKLSTYEQCAQKAKFKYIDRLQEEKGAAAVRGTSLHASAEGYLKKEKNTIKKELMPIVAALVETRNSSPLIEHKMAFSRGFEEVVPWKSSDAWFRLVLDAAYQKAHQALVQEWKSGKIYDDHLDQRQLYGIGALLEWPDVDEAVVTTHYIDQRTARPTTVTRKRATILVWQFNERLDRMEREKHFVPRPGYYCSWCPFSRFKGGPCKVG